MESGGRGEFLPPEPPGPAPELGAPPAQSPAPQQQATPPPPQSWQPPPQWGYPPPSNEPDNGAAIAGFVTSVVSGTLLVMSFGFLSVITLIASPFGIHYSRKGKQAVEQGRTPKHRSLAQAGYVIGIITFVLSLIATVAVALFLVKLFTDDDFRRNFEDNGGGGGGGFDSTSAALALAAVRMAVRLVS